MCGANKWQGAEQFNYKQSPPLPGWQTNGGRECNRLRINDLFEYEHS